LKRYSLALLPLILLTCACSEEDTEIRPLFTAEEAPLGTFDQAYQAGKSHLAGGRPGLAIVQFARALAVAPGSVAALNATGAAYDALHRPDLALAFYRRALEIEPDAPDTLNNLAVSMIQAGELEEGRRLLAQAVARSPADRVIAANRDHLARESEGSQLAALPAPMIVAARVAPQPHLARSGLSRFDLTLPKEPRHRRVHHRHRHLRKGVPT
jgi:Flp pilus assembly protein TadD